MHDKSRGRTGRWAPTDRDILANLLGAAVDLQHGCLQNLDREVVILAGKIADPRWLVPSILLGVKAVDTPPVEGLRRWARDVSSHGL
jgi:hypothetical protein